ncbi:interferon regulatory factor 9 [Tenrec ecaudatus]|uniref:interferon regulatory factor 9 n=1 Tax=Tenrec ecaudatus TaxID=94439 RepID=UPI003F5AB332
MASGKARCTRKLRNWVVEQVESENFPGVRWDDDAKTMFRIPWKHAGKQDFRQDQDAGFFKAWAIFKGKYKEGDAEGPATWKTRLRCALNKSPEFEEVPERGHMDGAEPYKVYRLLPPGTLAAQPDTQKSPSKRHHSSIPSAGEEEEEEEEKESVKKHRLGPFWDQEPLSHERGASREADHAEMGRSSSSESSSESPKPQEGVNTAEDPFQEDQGSRDLELPQNSDYSLLITFIYNGRVVRETQVHALDCRLVAEPLSFQSNMEQVFFPRPDPLEPTQHLLNQLEKGVMVASNPQGLFVQRLCPVHISWDAPQNPPGQGPHLLPSKECVNLFKTDCFLKDMAKYKQGLGPPPKYQVTLNFWEDSPGPNHTSQNLITVQLEQAFARHLLQETREEQTAALSLVQRLEEDTANSSPFILFISSEEIHCTHCGPALLPVHSQ